MEHFDSFKDYFRFVTAGGFFYQNNDVFNYEPNKLERVGSWLSCLVLRPVDYGLRNIKNPAFIIAMTITGLFIATLLFYPATLALLIVGVPLIKGVCYVVAQSTVVGLCLRTLGRLRNKELMEAWDSKKLIPFQLGQ